MLNLLLAGDFNFKYVSSGVESRPWLLHLCFIISTKVVCVWLREMGVLGAMGVKSACFGWFCVG